MICLQRMSSSLLDMISYGLRILLVPAYTIRGPKMSSSSPFIDASWCPLLVGKSAPNPFLVSQGHKFFLSNMGTTNTINRITSINRIILKIEFIYHQNLYYKKSSVSPFLMMASLHPFCVQYFQLCTLFFWVHTLWVNKKIEFTYLNTWQLLHLLLKFNSSPQYCYSKNKNNYTRTRLIPL